jgi:raffinose/stachyose/melibiose transport system permease protein
VNYAICIVFAFFALAPICVLVANSLRTDKQIASTGFELPGSPQWHNFSEAWTSGEMGQALWNTAVYVLVTVVIVCILAGMAAYALLHLRVRFGGGVMTYLVLASGLPIQGFLVPLFILWTHLGLYDSYLGLVLIYVATSLPFAVLLMRSYLLQIPADFVNSARVDGAGELRIARSIILPMAWPGMVSVALVTAVAVYNDFIFAVTFTQSARIAPISLSFFSFLQGHSVNYALLAAGGLIITLPMLLLFIVLQRRFIEGLSASGLRG